MAPQPFRLQVADAAIDDLRERLARTRFPDQAPGEPWAYGTDVAYLQAWSSTGAPLRLARAGSAAQRLSAVHGAAARHRPALPPRRGQGPAPFPLLLSHGWPGSVFEFLDIIPRLTDPARFGGDPADAFTVVAPSLPGYGLSFKPGQPRFSPEAIADCFAELMTDVLGYRALRRAGRRLGRLHHLAPRRGACREADRHPPQPAGAPARCQALADPTPEETRLPRRAAAWLKEETGYQWIQGTRPQTLAFGLTDSPAGLAAWIVEKFRAWSDCGGDVESVFSRDHLLANIGLYWFTGAIGSSFWPYYARMHGPGRSAKAASARRWATPPSRARSSARRARWPSAGTPTSAAGPTMPRGGHFAAMEQPEALAREIVEFFRPLRPAAR